MADCGGRNGREGILSKKERGLGERMDREAILVGWRERTRVEREWLAGGPKTMERNRGAGGTWR